jgi:hypothetical protein
MRRETLGSNDQAQSDLAEALNRLVRILAREAAREVVSTPALTTESVDE